MRMEVLIVDNGSIEEATHRLFAQLARDPHVQVLASPGAFNYSALNNFAARLAKGEILALLNNDLEVVNEDWLAEMVGLASRPEVGCVGAKLLYPDGRVQHAGVYLGPGALAGHGYRWEQADISGQLNRMRTVQNVSAITGACLFTRKSVFDEVGGLDERHLKVALNDVDYCLKVRKAGYLNLWTPFAELVHYESQSRGRDRSPTKARRLAYERDVFRTRWGTAIFADPYYSPNLTHEREDFSERER
jgi:GT2 family glycosyltransferase